MRVEVDINPIRWAFVCAKREFISLTNKEGYPYPKDIEWWSTFGRFIGAGIIIDGYINSYPVVNRIVFDDEKAFTWFLLKWD